MARNAKKVYENVKKSLPNKLKDKLEDDSSFWAPESFLYQLTMWVNNYIKPDSTSDESVRTYAALLGCTPREMRREFIRNGE